MHRPDTPGIHLAAAQEAETHRSTTNSPIYCDATRRCPYRSDSGRRDWMRTDGCLNSRSFGLDVHQATKSVARSEFHRNAGVLRQLRSRMNIRRGFGFSEGL